MPGLSVSSVSISAVLCLCWVIHCSVYVFVCYSCTLSAFFVTRLLFVCLGRLLRLHSLCLVCSVYVGVCCAMPMLVGRCSVYVCVCYTYALFTSSVVDLLFVYLGCLLFLYSQCLVHFLCVCVWRKCIYACVFFLLCQRCWF